ncbi:aquaporin-5-like [Dermochelys coriacea]|uniref:aquaporin-5-like n=1 Tax=Dermochelys coriacea TaxID=27794 RepID=UPI0018E75BED|nr:aquaporin-5-like [Dermochelys coriacea]
MELPRVTCRAWDVCLLKALLAEFMGTGIFLFTSLASITPWTQPAVDSGNLGITAQSQSSVAGSEPSSTVYSAPPAAAATPSLGDVGKQAPCSLAYPNSLHVSLAFGSSAAVMSYCALPLSGGHLNPAVTVSMLAAVKVRPAWAMCYILAQLLGGITASALLYGLTPEHTRGEMGVNKPSRGQVLAQRTLPPCNAVVLSLLLKAQLAPGVTLLQALSIEVIISFQLVLCILTTSGSKRDPSKGRHLVIGLSVMLGHLVAINYTGCSMNPARSLGPALITFEFANHWVFWLGPLGGGLAAAILNELVLAPTGSGFRQWLTMLQEGPKAERNLQSKAESTTQEMGLSETP